MEIEECSPGYLRNFNKGHLQCHHLSFTISVKSCVGQSGHQWNFTQDPTCQSFLFIVTCRSCDPSTKFSKISFLVFLSAKICWRYYLSIKSIFRYIVSHDEKVKTVKIYHFLAHLVPKVLLVFIIGKILPSSISFPSKLIFCLSKHWKLPKFH